MSTELEKVVIEPEVGLGMSCKTGIVTEPEISDVILSVIR